MGVREDGKVLQIRAPDCIALSRTLRCRLSRPLTLRLALSLPSGLPCRHRSSSHTCSAFGDIGQQHMGLSNPSRESAGSTVDPFLAFRNRSKAHYAEKLAASEASMYNNPQ